MTKDNAILPLAQAAIVWYPEDTCTTFQVAKIHARLIQFHQKYSIETTTFENINPDRFRSNRQN